MQVNTELYKAVKKALIDKSMTMKDLARITGRGYSNLNKQFSGFQRMSDGTKQILKEYLGIDADKYAV